MSKVNFTLDPPREWYVPRWRKNCSNAQTIIDSWSTTVTEIKNAQTTFTFDIMEGDTPLLVGHRTLVAILIATTTETGPKISETSW